MIDIQVLVTKKVRVKIIGLQREPPIITITTVGLKGHIPERGYLFYAYQNIYSRYAAVLATHQYSFMFG